MPTIELRPIDQVKPDKNQPRKIFDKGYIDGLAKNLRIEGMINAIEVDSDDIIITGECRWRAANLVHSSPEKFTKDAKEQEKLRKKWAEVPVVVNSKTFIPYNRFRRQMSENLHQSSADNSSRMNPIDVAKGYVRLLKMKGFKLGAAPNLETLQRGRIGNGLSELSRDLGVSRRTICSYIQILQEPKHILEDIRRGASKTLYEEAAKLPEEYRDNVKKAILEKKVTNKEIIRRLKRLAKITPEKAELEILRIQKKQSEEANAILNKAVELSLVLARHKPDKMTYKDKAMIFKQLGSTSGAIRNYLGKLKNANGEIQEAKAIEGEVNGKKNN